MLLLHSWVTVKNVVFLESRFLTQCTTNTQTLQRMRSARFMSVSCWVCVCVCVADYLACTLPCSTTHAAAAAADDVAY